MSNATTTQATESITVSARDEARKDLAAAEERYANLDRQMYATRQEPGEAWSAYQARAAIVTEQWERAATWLKSMKRVAARRGVITATMGVTLDEARAYLRAKGRPCGG